MGIHGLLAQLGPAPRSSLAALSATHYTTHSRPLILAIDISIWLFQIQSGKGGSNPALRTFYYRLLRLLSLNIHPLFVFDGPNKPLFKRNKKVGGPGVKVASVPEFLAKQLLKEFGFPWHVAPGEAEAECAMLQQKGVCDAVLSEDVDTLMFGSGVTFRNWGAADLKGGGSNKTPTHVSVYREAETTERSRGVDREGMILVALMSGGDYLPEGIPGCGPKVACDAARAGFGRELCALRRSDGAGLRAWKERLQHEIRTNESKFFSRRNNGFTVPEDFPNHEVLGYYTHPCVSSPEKVERLRSSLKFDQPIDFAALRTFAGDAFDWRCVGGAKKFIKNLAPALLIRQLRLHGENAPQNLSEQSQEEAEKKFVGTVHGKRNHASVDGELELRVSFTPANLVPINLDEEEEDDDFLPAGGETSDTESDIVGMLPPSTQDDDDDSDAPAKKKRVPKPFDPDQPEKIWVLKTFLQIGCPLLVEEYEASQRDPKAFFKQRQKARGEKGGATANIHAKGKAASGKGRKKAAASSDGPTVIENALTRYAKVTKGGVDREREPLGEKSSSQSFSNEQPLAPTYSAPPAFGEVGGGGGIRDDALDRLFKVPSTQRVDAKLAELRRNAAKVEAALAAEKQRRVEECEAVDLTDTTPKAKERPFAAFAKKGAAGADAGSVESSSNSASSDVLDFTGATGHFAAFKNPAAKPGPGPAAGKAKSKGKKVATGQASTQDVQRTPQRRKRRSPDLSSPAVPSSQKTITAYYSPSSRKATRLFPGVDTGIVNLISSSPAKLPAYSPPRARSLTPTPPNLRDKFVRSPSPVLEYASLLGGLDREDEVPEFSPGKLPDTVTKRRRKGPLRRAKTAPVSREVDETLDLGFGGHTGVSSGLGLTSVDAIDLAETSPLRLQYDDGGGGGGFFVDDEDVEDAGGSLSRYSPPAETSMTKHPKELKTVAAPSFRERLLGGAGVAEDYPTPPTTAGNDAEDAASAAPKPAPSGKGKPTSTASAETATESLISRHLATKLKPRSKVKAKPTPQPASAASLTPMRRSPRQAQKKRAFILRQSLEGAWKEVDAETVDMSGDGSGWKASGGRATIVGSTEQGRGRTFRKSGVEVLDMTGA